MIKASGSRHWVAGFLESGPLWLTNNRLFASIIKSGTVPNIYLGVLLAFRWDSMPNSVVMGYICSYIWLNIGPYLIWRFDQRSLPSFRAEVRSILVNETTGDRILLSYCQIFRRWSLLAALPWAIFNTVVWAVTSTSTDRLGVFGLSDPLWWLGTLLAGWAGILTGIGFFGVILAVFATSKVSHCGILLEPLHHDNHAGLGCFGRFTIHTTVMFASGALFLPMVIAGIGPSDEMTCFVFLILAAFSGFVILSFATPIYSVHTNAVKIRNKSIDDLVTKYRELSMEISSGRIADTIRSRKCEELTWLYHERWQYRHVRLYPIDVDTIMKLAVSVLLPFVLFLLNKAL